MVAEHNASSRHCILFGHMFNWLSLRNELHCWPLEGKMACGSFEDGNEFTCIDLHRFIKTIYMLGVDKGLNVSYLVELNILTW